MLMRKLTAGLVVMVGCTIAAAEPARREDPPAKKPADDSASASKDKSPPAKGESLEGKDKELDDLLGKFADTPDEPEAKGKAQPGAKPGIDPKPGDAMLKPDEKPLDDELERILGRKKKKSNNDQEDNPNNPLSQTVKKMREVEKRLEKPDTGEQTRQKQEQIVKDLDQLLERIRKGQLDGQGRRALRRVQRPGRPGDQANQQNPNNQGGNPPVTKPEKPKSNNMLARGKDIWGDLQAELRADVDNVVNEQPVPARKSLIERYLLSVSKKSLSRDRSQ